jgi:cell wall-associated NlpC family hydrolase
MLNQVMLLDISKKDLLAIGEAAEKIAPKYITRYAVVNTVTLNVREKASTDAKIVIQIGQDEVYKIIKEYAEWYLIKIDSETLGFITKEKEYVKVVGKFAHAISMEEILAQEEEEEEEQQEETNNNTSQTTTRSNNSNSTRRSTTTKRSSVNRRTSTSKKSNSSSSSSSTSTRGKSVASYALQFVGNPYVYGGSSLTNGTDCSGFTQSIYRNYGKSIPRTSRAQYASAGRIVSMNDLKSGDLLFYSGSGGTVNHVAIYIGNGQVVHASNKRDGIKVSSYNYRTPVRARRVMN